MIETEAPLADWLQSLLRDSRPRGRKGADYPRLAVAAEHYPPSARKSFEAFIKSKDWETVRRAGLLLI